MLDPGSSLLNTFDVGNSIVWEIRDLVKIIIIKGCRKNIRPLD